MNDLQTAFFAIHAVFTGAFLLAFALPLAMAGAEERAEKSKTRKPSGGVLDSLGPLFDLWLILQDSIPVFWILRMVRDAPDDARAARRKWKEESSIRMCFWFAVVLIATLPGYLMFD